MRSSSKGKVVLAQPAAALAPPPTMLATRRLPLPRAPPAPVRGAGEDAAYHAGLRYRGLFHDYQDLLKETEAKNRRLQMMKLMKRRLLAEVRFLRKRYESMSENPSQTIVCRLRNTSVPPPPALTTAATWPADINVEHRSVPAAAVGSSSSRSLPAQARQRHLEPPMASPAIDLNEACEPSHEEMELGEHHGYRQPPPGINNTRRYYYPVEGVAAAGPSGMRMPVLWDAKNPAARAGKRKISYQDPLVLGV